ncbi:MAG: transcriptional regulator [Phycisphaerae bacterium SM23_33]|nr:MAG: transcriptional regulator [Phycisphaerae bacterium SM23_33]
MEVPLLDLKAQFETIRQEVLAAIEAVIETHQYCNGPPVRELERLLAEYCGCAAAVGVSSGTDALLCSLMALGVGAGDEVITTPYTFFATAGAVWRVGARPVFVDVEPDTLNIDPSKIEPAVTGKTKAIIPVHLFGQMAEMDPIMAVANRHGLPVIEDAAQAIGATYKGRQAGCIGTVGCLSFYPSKNLGAMGDAGVIVTQDPKLAEKIAVLRVHGESQRYFHEYVGGNFRMDSIQAAALIVKLRYLDGWSAKRRAHAARYDELLADLEAVRTPVTREHNGSNFYQYVIRAPRRDELKAFLARQGVGTAIYYPLSLHQQACFESLGYQKGDFPHSERAAAETLALPVYPELTDEQIVYVAGKIKQFMS